MTILQYPFSCLLINGPNQEARQFSLRPLGFLGRHAENQTVRTVYLLGQGQADIRTLDSDYGMPVAG
jgi:hypothetical protein